MIAALATLTFLVTLWLLVVIGAAVLEASGGKILAALAGEVAVPTLTARTSRQRRRLHQPQRAVRISARQRAAA